MTKLSKEDFYKKFIKKQDILEATTDNPIILGVVPDPDEVWAYCEAYAKQQREEIIKMLKEEVKNYTTLIKDASDDSLDLVILCAGIQRAIKLIKKKDD